MTVHNVETAAIEPEVSRFRRILPQILASLAKNVLMFDMGLAYSFSVIAIPALTGKDPKNNPDEFLHITDDEVSWLGSILFPMQGLGSILSGFVAGYFGRKRAMYIINIPHLFAWFLLYYARSVTEIFIGNILLGLGNGLMEAPTITYIGEISEPSMRGSLTALTLITNTLGMFMAIFLGNFMSFRHVSLLFVTIPCLTFALLFFIPESPHWLFTQNRAADALRSLQWLRGWVTPKAVEKEFQELERYHKQASACLSCNKKGIACLHPPSTLLEKLRDIPRRRTLKPIVMLLMISACSQLAGLASMRPYLVLTLNAYGVPMDAHFAASLAGIVGFIATLVPLIAVKIIGKRGIYLTSMFGDGISCFVLGIYGFTFLPIERNSIGEHSNLNIDESYTYIPLIAFMALSFFTNFGVWTILWMMMSEIFPAKSRELTTSMAALFECIFIFIATKVYLDLETIFYMPGAAIFFGVVAITGFTIAYFILPETEGRSLEEIELHYADNSRSFMDIDIKKIGATK